MPSLSYMIKLVAKTKEYVPDWLFKQLHLSARAYAGGKARHGNLEKADDNFVPEDVAEWDEEMLDSIDDETIDLFVIPDEDAYEVSKPYSTKKPPKKLRKLPAKKKRQWIHVYSAQRKRGMSEARAHASAWSAVKKEDDEQVDEALVYEIVKVDNERQIIYSVVYEPDAEDSQGDFAKADEIEKAAHRFLKGVALGTAYIDINHDNMRADVNVIESFVAPCDFTYANGQLVKEGSWVMAMHVESSETWALVKESLGGVSMAGHGKRVES